MLLFDVRRVYAQNAESESEAREAKKSTHYAHKSSFGFGLLSLVFDHGSNRSEHKKQYPSRLTRADRAPSYEVAGASCASLYIICISRGLFSLCAFLLGREARLIFAFRSAAERTERPMDTMAHTHTPPCPLSICIVYVEETKTPPKSF